jgi:hypothetical protein
MSLCERVADVWAAATATPLPCCYGDESHLPRVQYSSSYGREGRIGQEPARLLLCTVEMLGHKIKRFWRWSAPEAMPNLRKLWMCFPFRSFKIELTESDKDGIFLFFFHFLSTFLRSFFLIYPFINSSFSFLSSFFHPIFIVLFFL